MEFMEDALKNAQEAFERKEVPVGCVFIYKNEIIARGSNEVNETKNATRHAEMICIDLVLSYCKKLNLDPQEVFREIVVVVTVEPCIMCAAALHNLSVKEIVFGCKNDRFGGTTVVNVFELLQSSVKIVGGVRDTEAMDLLKEFYKGENPSAPLPKTKRKV
ncbi:tRNA-specific adenosine deaminase 2 [Culicoides brevitarsis]|uniref:tRNA-specific adenosine deaminase 2 n=1 Tax=Culicoides brevitarsis TaxID=469753 RepID=UPI00307B325B